VGKDIYVEININQRRMKMSDKTMEMMKKLIEEKKQKGTAKGNNLRPDKSIGSTKKAVSNKKTGGLFD